MKKNVVKVLMLLTVSALMLSGCNKKEEPSPEPEPTEEAQAEEPGGG